jgi:hypothetical protein
MNISQLNKLGLLTKAITEGTDQDQLQDMKHFFISVVNWTTDDQRHLGPDQELSNCEENI